MRGPCQRGPGRGERGGAGFTLVEILVVIAIISVLAGLITVSVQHARGLANVKATRWEIQQLLAAAEGFKNSFGYYPPTSVSSPPLNAASNGINDGIESLLAFVSTRKGGGPFLSDISDDRLDNLDEDKLSAKDLLTVKKEIDWTRGNAAMLEYCDMWGNPFVYLHHRDYDARQKMKYQTADRKVIEVKAARSEKTGTYQGATSFQLWSFGPNRINENGQGDDIVSWRE